jgi:hypothetical protein
MSNDNQENRRGTACADVEEDAVCRDQPRRRPGQRNRALCRRERERKSEVYR